MPVETPAVRSCPECGGMLQPTATEPLIVSEFTSSDAGARAAPAPRQCLICGYEDAGGTPADQPA